MKLLGVIFLRILIKIICATCVAIGLTTISSAVIGPVENTYEEILQESISDSLTQVPEDNETKIPEAIEET